MVETSENHGLITWLSDHLGRIHWSLGKLDESITTNRRMLANVEKNLNKRMDHIEHLARSRELIKSVPWWKFSIAISIALLLITGHMTVAEIKALIAQSLLK